MKKKLDDDKTRKINIEIPKYNFKTTKEIKIPTKKEDKELAEALRYASHNIKIPERPFIPFTKEQLERVEQEYIFKAYQEDTSNYDLYQVGILIAMVTFLFIIWGLL